MIKIAKMNGGDLFEGLTVAPPSPSKVTQAFEPESAAQAVPSVPVSPSKENGLQVPMPTSPRREVSSASNTSAGSSAPVTDKLLGMLGDPSPPSPSRTTAPPAPAPVTPAEPTASPPEKMPPKVPRSKNGEEKEALELSAVFSVDTTPGPDEKASKKPISKATTVPPLDDNEVEEKLKSKRGVGVVDQDTPVPNADVALRLFRKFASKTRPLVPTSHGGTLRLSILNYVFGTPPEYDRKFDAYKDLMEVIVDDETEAGAPPQTHPEPDENDKIVDSILGQSGDNMAKARKAVARFCHLLSVWGHASAHMAEAETQDSSYKSFCGILASGLDTATSLVTHGCLDGVQIGIGPNNDEYHKAVDVLCQSVFNSDLSQERNELSAVKFLLSTGCRVGADGESMLRGTHLLQTVRVLYHVYLTTESNANKTTARASLQQLVTSVFVRMIASSSPPDHPTEHTSDEGASGTFPTENHRDAFLVLRSLCKLSMRNPPSNMQSHIGFHAGGSNTTWDASKDTTFKTLGRGSGEESQNTSSEKQNLHLFTQAIHPALESKILALNLLLYVLQTTNMQGSFLQHCGSQFHNAIRNYLCVSLLKNCTSDDTRVVNLSLRVFVPIIRDFRSILKAEIEAFVTNVFFVILDSKNSPIEHKILVVTLFAEICSDPTTLAEIFLNYDCDLSAVDLFHRIVNTLSKVARSFEVEEDPSKTNTISLVTGAGAFRMEKLRSERRELRLAAMRALRQVLASLHASIVQPLEIEEETKEDFKEDSEGTPISPDRPEKKSLVQIYDSKKKRREETSEATLRFNQKPSAGIAYAAQCGHLDGSEPTDVAQYLLNNKDRFDKTQIGEYLGREPDYQNGFSLKVLHAYVNAMDFSGLMFDDAIRFYLSGFRLPGEAQKIDRIMEKFAERYTAQNPDVFPTADVAFILAFSIIMLNTDLHNPAIKEERRMTKDGFIRNNRGICDGQDLPRDLLTDIFDRIKTNPISLKEDDEARERAGESKTLPSSATSLPAALNPSAFFTSHYDELDKTKETNFNKERDQIVRTTESLLKRGRHSSVDHGKSNRKNRSENRISRPHHVRYVRTKDSGLRDEYVSPMFEVAWGPALAAFSIAMESANGTVGALLSIATDEELEAAAANAAETIEVCLTGFRFAVCTAGLCGNDVARDSYMLALTRFSQLGTGILLEPRHIRCIQTMLGLAMQDGELLESSWEHVFKALSEINRFHQLFQLMARNDRVIAQAAERRKARLQERETKLRERKERQAAKEASDSLDDSSIGAVSTGGLSEVSFGDSDIFSDSDDFDFADDMDKKEIDEANARSVYEAVSEGVIEAIYERSSSLSTTAVKEFVLQLCRVSRMEISHYGGQVGGDANKVDLTQVHYRQHHTLLQNSQSKEGDAFHHHQPNIYNLQRLVEVTHYNMDSRPRLVFADLWQTVAAHLTSTALHSNPAVAMYAVDSFRQLSIQYLQREELGVFEFQRRFLKPLETVMSRSELATTKELLLKCVERLIVMFGSSDGEGNKGGMLRSGWRPVLMVLGLAGRDADEDIAKLGFTMLTEQLKPCLPHENSEDGEEKTRPGILLAERFVDLVDALLTYVEGPHEDMSLKSIDNLLTLAAFLADESFALPFVKRRPAIEEEGAENNDAGSNQELELWWPILLGLSRSVGDSRKKVRMKSLDALMEIVTTHFFPSSDKSEPYDDAKKDSQLQTLQLVFRGILTPVLEYGEADAPGARPPNVPSDFERFLTAPKEGESKKSPSKSKKLWLDTTFDQFLDGCVSICLRSIDVFGEDTLVEEIFAILNSCLLSDSGAMAVRGLRRLEQFVGSDLKLDVVTDDTWATVSHMLRRCLSLRGLPRTTSSTMNGASDTPKQKGDTEGVMNPELEEKETIREFVMEDNMLADRRYVGANVVQVMGSFLGGERFSETFGLRWRLFLVAGLGRAIRDWEHAASILAKYGGKTKSRGQKPPHYLETAYYGRKWMIRFLLQIASMKEIAETAIEGSRQAAAQTLIKEQTQALVTAFLKKEAALSGDGKKSALETHLFNRLTGLVKDMLAGYDKLPDEHLGHMSWLNPVLSSCIHTSNESIRIAIQKLVKRLV